MDAANSEMLEYMRRVKDEHTSSQALEKEFLSEHPLCSKFFVVDDVFLALLQPTPRVTAPVKDCTLWLCREVLTLLLFIAVLEPYL